MIPNTAASAAPDRCLALQAKALDHMPGEKPRFVTVHDHFDVPLDPTTDDGKATIAAMLYYEATGEVLNLSVRLRGEARPGEPADGGARPDNFGEEVTRLCREIRKPCSLAWRDSLFEQLIDLIDPQPYAASASPAVGSASDAADVAHDLSPVQRDAEGRANTEPLAPAAGSGRQGRDQQGI